MLSYYVYPEGELAGPVESEREHGGQDAHGRDVRVAVGGQRLYYVISFHDVVLYYVMTIVSPRRGRRRRGPA